MKNLIFALVSMTTLLTAAQPILAQESSSSMKMEAAGPESTSELNLHLNPQIGLSDFEHKGKSGSAHSAAFGATVELGQSQRKLETGLLLMSMGSDVANSTYLAIPMMAKLRILAMRAQSWYAKFGFTSAFEMTSTNKRATNNIDVLMGAGLGGRLAITRAMDFVIEATFNRGLMDAVHGGGNNYNQGFLVLGGLSLAL